MEDYLAVAYWKKRKEDARACSVRASKFLSLLSKYSGEMTGWREKGLSRKIAFDGEIYNPQNLDRLEQLISKGLNKHHPVKDGTTELGFRVELWNGKDGNHVASLTIKCGLYSIVDGLTNAVVLSMPKSINIADANSVGSLVAAFINAWDPEWMALTSRSRMRECGSQKPFLDKALYVRSGMQQPPVPVDTSGEILYGGTLYLNL